MVLEEGEVEGVLMGNQANLVLADTISRAPEINQTTTTEKEVEHQVNMIVESLPVSKSRSCKL